jgi:putative FmdB family regulatory protein
MPTYEYACSKCDGQFEIFQSMSDKALTTCPKEKCCQKKWGKGKVKRLMGSGAGLIFKGSGFYITDYRSEGYKQAAKKDSGGGESKSASSSGESKPASSGEKKSSTPAPTPVKKESKAKS